MLYSKECTCTFYNDVSLGGTHRHPLGGVPLFLCANLAIEFVKIINSSLSASVIHYMRTNHRQIAYATYAKIQQNSQKGNKLS